MSDDIRILCGRPTDEEVAALVCALAAVRSRGGPDQITPLWTVSARPGWRGPDGRPLRRGPSAWADGARPR